MNFAKGLLALVLALAAGAAQASVGYRHFSIPDPAGAPIEAGVWYPADAPAQPTAVETFVAPLAKDAPVRGHGLPLVVISHGSGGSYAGHVDTAIALAEAGFVVAAITHTGDNWRDQSGATRIWDRSRQLKLLTDHMLAVWPDHGAIDPARIGAFGFSAGGFTVLTLAGGEADLSRMAGHCLAHPTFFDCRLVAASGARRPAGPVWTHDARIRAVVSAAPALGYAFGREGLARVRQPVQLWRAENDEVLVHPYYAEAVRQALPKPPEHHVVAGAGHYDFLAPCSPTLTKINAGICRSAEGFDRAAFHRAFNREVVAFFLKTLAPRR